VIDFGLRMADLRLRIAEEMSGMVKDSQELSRVVKNSQMLLSVVNRW